MWGGGAWLALTLVVSVSHVAACEAVKLNTRCLGPRISSLTSISRSLLRVYTFWVCVCVCVTYFRFVAFTNTRVHLLYMHSISDLPIFVAVW